MAQPFVHMELNTPDLAKAKDFYGKLFGWTFTDNDMGAHGIYSMFRPDSGPGGGMFTMAGPTFWLPYVGVDNLRDATDKAKSLGAIIHKDSVPVPGHGIFSIIADPTGAVIALWEAETQPDAAL